jgi:hypothetical protein
VGDGLHVGGAVAVLHEEALVVLEPVRRADDRVVESVGVVVLEHLANALLEAGGGDDLAVGRGRQLGFAALPVGRLRDDGEEAVARAAEEAGEDDLRLQPSPYSGMTVRMAASRRS